MGPEPWREARARAGDEAGWVALSQVFPSGFLSGAREQAWLEGINSPGGILEPKKDRSGGHRLQPPSSGRHAETYLSSQRNRVQVAHR